MYKVQRGIVLLLCMVCSFSLSAQDFSADRELFAAYQREDMPVWQAYIDSVATDSPVNTHLLVYEYGYCGYIVAEAKKEGKEALMPEAKRYVKQFKEHVEAMKTQLPAGHYEMYKSAVYVFELRLHESLHPLKAMDLAKKATQLAPEDPMTLTYYGTSLFYAPKAFGNKKEAYKWFEKASVYFADPKWEYCWLREANEMYKNSCLNYFKR